MARLLQPTLQSRPKSFCVSREPVCQHAPVSTVRVLLADQNSGDTNL